MIHEIMRKEGAIATTCSISLVLSGCALLSLDQSSYLPQPDLLCPFSGTEITFQLLQSVPDKTNADATNVGETHDAIVLETITTVLSKRIQELALRPTSVVVQSSNQILVQLPDSIPTDVQEQAIQILSQQGQLTFQEQRQGTSSAVLRTLLLESGQLQANASNSDYQAALEQTNEAILSLFHPPAITGDRIQDVRPQPLSYGSGDDQLWEIAIEFDAQGSAQFAQLTQQLAGTDRSLGIFWDQTLLSAPTVSVEYAATGITGGRASISTFTVEEASAMAIQLRSGTLPVPVELTEVRDMRRDGACSPQP